MGPLNPAMFGDKAEHWCASLGALLRHVKERLISDELDDSAMSDPSLLWV